MFLDAIKYLPKGKNCVLGLCQQTSKVQCLVQYLAFKDLKIRIKKGTQWLKS